MKYGFITPNFGDYGDAATLADLAAESEASGWDGFFIWDHLQWPGMEPAVDPRVALTAISMRTAYAACGDGGSIMLRVLEYSSSDVCSMAW